MTLDLKVRLSMEKKKTQQFDAYRVGRGLVKCGTKTQAVLPTQVLLSQLLLSLESDRVRLHPGDGSDVKFECADIPESLQERP